MTKDLRFALRQLGKTPVTTLTIIATLALCIGANAAIFSIVDAVLLRPLPYPDPASLALVISYAAMGDSNGIDTAQDGAEFQALRDGASGLDVAAASGMNAGVNFYGNGRARLVQQARVSEGYFRVLGVLPRLGRAFTSIEDRDGGPQAVVLSDTFWRRALLGDQKIIGKAILLRGDSYTVVGVMPPGFRTDQAVDVWTPLRPSTQGEGGGTNYEVIARLKAGWTWRSATAQLRAISEAVRPSYLPKKAVFEERIVPLQFGSSYENRTQILLPWAAAGIVLLIGCANIAGLLLARSATRRREVATKLAVGASRWAITRELLLETALLSLAGGGLGLLLGAIALDYLKAFGAERFELWHPIVLDTRVVAAMLIAAVGTTVLFGLIPALDLARLPIRSVLVDSDRGVAGQRSTWIRSALLIGEVALSLVLLISAILVTRSFSWLQDRPPGFNPHSVLTAQTSLLDKRYQTATKVNALFDKALEQIRAVPGVQSAAVALTLPYQRPLNDGFRDPNGQDHMAEFVYTTPGFFETLNISLDAGRTFSPSDTAESQKVVIVSQAFAKRYFRNARRALNSGITFGNQLRQIVGVVGDTQQTSGLQNLGPVSIEPTVYLPSSQLSDGFVQLVHVWFAPSWVVRSNLPPGDLETKLNRIIASVDPQLPIALFRPMQQLQQNSTQEQRYNAVLFSSVAVLALLLSLVGLYGMISQSVAQRTREMGIRMALGASVREVTTSLLGPGLRYTAFGILAGLLLSLLSSRFLAHLLWGVSSVDGTTFIAASAILLVCALIASLIPALRLWRLDPASTLHDQ